MKIKKLIYLSALALSPAILISAEISRIPNATKDIKYENQTDGAKDIFSKYKNINNTKGMPSDTVAPVITGPLKSIELPNYLDNNIITPGNVFDNDDKTSWISTYFGFENNGTWEDAQDKEHYFQFQIEKSKFLKMFRINFGKEEKYLCDRIGIAFYSPYTSASEPSKLIHKINYTRSDFYKDPNSGYWFLNVADISKKVDDKITFVEINFFGGKKSALPFSDQLQDLWYKSAWKWNGSEYVCLTNTFSNGAKTGYIYRLNTGGTTETYDVRYKSQLEKLFKKYAGKQVAINEITSYSSTVEHDILNEIDKLEKSLDENKDYYTKNSYDKSKTIIKQIIEEYKNKLKTFFRIEITKADYDKEIEEINKRIFDSLVSNRDALSREINKYDTTNWDLYQPQSDELKNLLNKLKDENKLGDGITSLQLKDKIDSINTLKKTVFIKNNDVLKNKINELKDKVNVSDNYLTSDKTIIIDYLEKQDVSKDITRDDYNKKIIQLDNYIKQFNIKDKLISRISSEKALDYSKYTSVSKNNFINYLKDLEKEVNDPNFANNETTYNQKLKEIDEKKKLLEENKVNELKKFIEDSKKSVENNKSLPASEKEKLTKYLNEYNVPADVNNSDLQTKKKEIQDELAKATTFKHLLLEKIKSEENENYDKYTSASKTNYLNYLSDLKTKVNDSS
ncbi:hypothetical protein, partial [Mycoplasma elephantis]|uniref:hypothetical protein n=1 Tax=Mycoplasma elephantis TaxID=114882 RepID=UPI0005665DE5